MRTRLAYFGIAAAALAGACGGLDEIASTSAVETQQGALLPAIKDIEPWIKVLKKGLSSSTYKDVASSSSHFYVLTSTGIKQIAHGSESQITTAPHAKTIALDTIDYAGTTWNVVGARSKGTNAYAQLVLKAMNTAPVTVNLPSDIVYVGEIEARESSSTSVRIFLRVGTSLREFLYNGTLRSVQSIPVGAYDSGFTMTTTDSFITNMYYPYSRLVKRPFSGESIEEALKIDIANTAPVGQLTSGATTAVHVHAFNGTTASSALSPNRMDYSSYKSAPTAFYTALTSGGSGIYDLVQFHYSYIHFDKRPGTSFAEWNDLYVQANNNCYNYATNRETGNFAQPGFASGHEWLPSFEPTIVGDFAVYDGLERIAAPADGSFPVPPEGKTLLALVTGYAPDFDRQFGGGYHWYRLDNNNYAPAWTHKPGSLPATDRCYPYAATSPVVTDPRDRNCWNPNVYSTFGGFFLADANYFQTMGREQIGGNSLYSAPSTATATAGGGEAVTVSFALDTNLPQSELEVTDTATINRIKALHAGATHAQPAAAAASRARPAGRATFGLYVFNRSGIAGLPDVMFLQEGRLTTQVGRGQSATRGELAVDGADLETDLLDQAQSRGVLDARVRDRIRRLDGK